MIICLAPCFCHCVCVTECLQATDASAPNRNILTYKKTKTLTDCRRYCSAVPPPQTSACWGPAHTPKAPGFLLTDIFIPVSEPSRKSTEISGIQLQSSEGEELLQQLPSITLSEYFIDT